MTNENSNTVSVISTATNTIIATVPVGINPFLVAVSPNGNTVYVSNNSYTSPSNGSISVISTATNTVIATIALGSNDPAGLAVTPDGSKLYVTNTGNVSVISTATNTVTATIPIANSVASGGQSQRRYCLRAQRHFGVRDQHGDQCDHHHHSAWDQRH